MNADTYVLYDCKACGIVRARVSVPARGTEDVVDWLKQVQRWVGADHRRRSPGCPSRTCDLMVPATGTERIGGPVVN